MQMSGSICMCKYRLVLEKILKSCLTRWELSPLSWGWTNLNTIYASICLKFAQWILTERFWKLDNSRHFYNFAISPVQKQGSSGCSFEICPMVFCAQFGWNRLWRIEEILSIYFHYLVMFPSCRSRGLVLHLNELHIITLSKDALCPVWLKLV